MRNVEKCTKNKLRIHHIQIWPLKFVFNDALNPFLIPIIWARQNFFIIRKCPSGLSTHQVSALPYLVLTHYFLVTTPLPYYHSNPNPILNPNPRNLILILNLTLILTQMFKIGGIQVKHFTYKCMCVRKSIKISFCVNSVLQQRLLAFCFLWKITGFWQ